MPHSENHEEIRASPGSPPPPESPLQESPPLVFSIDPFEIQLEILVERRSVSEEGKEYCEFLVMPEDRLVHGRMCHHERFLKAIRRVVRTETGVTGPILFQKHLRFTSERPGHLGFRVEVEVGDEKVSTGTWKTRNQIFPEIEREDTSEWAFDEGDDDHSEWGEIHDAVYAFYHTQFPSTLSQNVGENSDLVVDF